jgi:hypothetical protein
MTKAFVEKAAAYLKRFNVVKLRQITLAILGLGVISLGVGLMFVPAGVICAGISIIVINIGWEDKRT